ncbi:MAG: glycosyltransferase family 2 protein [Bacteroidales bacterium]|nr:glycosyltransferase family 2 protein [Bacteroidales bacterium]
MNNSLISIIVPVYNVKDYVGRCLESIAAQTYSDIEVIIIDDGSTDGSGAICDEFCQIDNRFCVIHQKNAGLGFARNTGLDKANGEYILFVDSDDSIVPETLETAYRAISSGTVDWVGFGFKRIDTHGNVLCSVEDGVPHHALFEVLTPRYLAKRIMDNKMTIDRGDPFEPVWNKLYSREIIGDLRFEFAKIAEDVCFNYRVYLRTRKAVFINKDLYQYYYRKTSISSSITKEDVFLNFAHRITLEQYTVPNSKDLFRVAYLRKIYRVMTTHRAGLLGTEYYSSFMEICLPFRKRTVWEYVMSRSIPLLEKVFSLSLWLFPHIGRCLLN